MLYSKIIHKINREIYIPILQQMKRIATLGQNGTFVSVKTNAPKVGSYAQISSQNSRPWSTASSKKTISRKTSRRRKKKVLYPIFEECARIATDPFWRDKFEKASFGKLPRGFTINKDSLIYKRGTKNDWVIIPSTPHEAYSVCVFFFQSAAKIYSDLDRKRIDEEEKLMQLQEQLKERTWAKTLKRQKEVLVELYIHELREEYQLSVDAAKRLEDLITIGILYNHFNKDNIILEEGMIARIEGLVYNPELKQFTTQEPLKPKTSKSSSKAKKIEASPLPRHISFNKEKYIDFYDEWDRLLEQSIKVIAKDTRQDTMEEIRVARVTSPVSERVGASTGEYTESTFTPTMETISTTD